MKKDELVYDDDKLELQGYVAFDETSTTPRPGVLVVHQWNGHDAYARRRACDLVALGYVGFAGDMFGKGILYDDDEAETKVQPFYDDPDLMRRRLQAGVNKLKQLEMVDASRIAAIGYCFGGRVVLEFARSGAKINGVVSFHGGLATKRPAKAGNVRAKILALHGANDAPENRNVSAFHQEMREARADWQMILYGGAVHGFTYPDAGDDASTGFAYDEVADRRSWEAMSSFLREIF